MRPGWRGEKIRNQFSSTTQWKELQHFPQPKDELTESLEDVGSVEVATESRFTGDDAKGRKRKASVDASGSGSLSSTLSPDRRYGRR